MQPACLDLWHSRPWEARDVAGSSHFSSTQLSAALQGCRGLLSGHCSLQFFTLIFEKLWGVFLNFKPVNFSHICKANTDHPAVPPQAYPRTRNRTDQTQIFLLPFSQTGEEQPHSPETVVSVAGRTTSCMEEVSPATQESQACLSGSPLGRDSGQPCRPFLCQCSHFLPLCAQTLRNLSTALPAWGAQDKNPACQASGAEESPRLAAGLLLQAGSAQRASQRHSQLLPRAQAQGPAQNLPPLITRSCSKLSYLLPPWSPASVIPIGKSCCNQGTLRRTS